MNGGTLTTKRSVSMQMCWVLSCLFVVICHVPGSTLAAEPARAESEGHNDATENSSRYEKRRQLTTEYARSWRAGDLEPTAQALRQLVELEAESIDPTSDRVVWRLRELADVMLEQEQLDEAVATAAKALAVVRSAHAADDWRIEDTVRFVEYVEAIQTLPRTERQQFLQNARKRDAAIRNKDWSTALEAAQQRTRTLFDLLGDRHLVALAELLGVQEVLVSLNRVETVDAQLDRLDRLIPQVSRTPNAVYAHLASAGAEAANRAGDRKLAELRFQRALDLYDQSGLPFLAGVASTHNNYAVLLDVQDRMDEASEHYRTAERLWSQELDVTDPVYATIQSNLVRTLLELGDTAIREHDWAAAENLLSESRQTAVTAWGAEHPLARESKIDLDRLVTIQSMSADDLSKFDRFNELTKRWHTADPSDSDAVIALCQERFQVAADLFGPDSFDALECEFDLHQQLPGDAETSTRYADFARRFARWVGDQHSLYAAAAIVQAGWTDPVDEAAVELAKQAVKIILREDGHETYSAASALSTLGRLQYSVGDIDADETLLAAEQHWHIFGGAAVWDQVNVFSDLATIYFYRDLNQKALTYSQKAIRTAEMIPDVDRHTLAVEYIQSGDIYGYLGKPSEAVAAYQKAARLTAARDEMQALFRDALLKAGNAYFGEQNYTAAVDVLTTLVDDYGAALDASDLVCVDGVEHLAASLRLLDRHDESLAVLARLETSISEGDQGEFLTDAQFVVAHQRIAIARDRSNLDSAKTQLQILGKRIQQIQEPENHIDDAVWFDWLDNLRDRADEFDVAHLSLWTREALERRARRVFVDRPWLIADAIRDVRDFRTTMELSDSLREELARADDVWNHAIEMDAEDAPTTIEPLERALAVRERILGPRHQEVIDSLETLGDQHRSLGRFVRAHELRQEVVRRMTIVLGDQHSQTAQAKVQQAITARDLSLFEESEALLLEALETLRTIHGSNSSELAGAYHSLAIHYLWSQQYAAALPAAREAVNRFRMGSGPESYDYANALRTLYHTYDFLGMDYESVDALNASHAIIKTLYEPTDPEYLDSTFAGALALSNYSDNDELARRLFIEAIEGYEALGPTYLDSLSNALNGYGNHCSLAGDYEQARELYEGALVARETFYDQENHPRIAQAHSQIGQVSLDLQDLESAEQHLELAYKMRRAVLGEHSGEVINGLYQLAKVKLLLGRYDEGYPLLMESLAIEQETLASNFLIGADEAISEVIDDNAGKYAWLLTTHLAGHAPADKLESALAWTLNRKGFALDAATRLQAVQRQAAHDPAVMQMQNELQGLRRLLAQNSVSDQEEEKVGPYGSRTRTVIQIDELEEQLALRLHQQAGDVVAMHIDVPALRRRIPRGSALLEYVVTSLADFDDQSGALGDEHVVAFYVPHTDEGPVRLIDLGLYADFEQDILALRRHIERTPRSLRLSSEADLESQFAELSAGLSQTLLGPFADEVVALDQLIVAPDGALHGLPFAALHGRPGKYLVEEVTLSYVSSGRDLLRDHAAVGRGSVVIADPDFDAAPDKRLAGSLPRPETSPDSTLLALRGSTASEDGDINLRSLLWRPLPGARQEAADVKQLLATTPYDPIQVYTGSAAMESVVRAAVSPRLMHLATHGFFVPHDANSDSDSALRGGVGGTGLSRLRSIENPLLRSGLVLAGANHPAQSTESQGDVDDGWLTAEEIASLDLRNTELVVLSACESGLGKVTSGHGVRGLQRAFFVAGVHGLMTALFEIPDAETRELVHAFYREFAQGRPRAESLQAAQRKTIAQRRADHGAAHPFYWASFTMLGRPELTNAQ